MFNLSWVLTAYAMMIVSARYGHAVPCSSLSFAALVSALHLYLQVVLWHKMWRNGHVVAVLVALFFPSPKCAFAWVGPAAVSVPSTTTTRHHQRSVRLKSSATSSGSSNDVLGGVDEFETWFASRSGASHLQSIQHQAFGSLRGLTINDDEKPFNPVVVLPSSLVLKSSMSNENWDAELAIKLWKECMLGDRSSIYGYCRLLTLGSATVDSTSESSPPSTAPNALRHWTENQKQQLQETPKGIRLLAYQQAQEVEWKNKYAPHQSQLSWEQFEWAMEVVHSRAFCGSFGSSGSSRTGVASPVASVAAPILAGAVGYQYWQNNADPNDVLLLGLALAGALPVFLSTLDNNQGDAVLLPFVDSANHLETADSSIEYNPISQELTLQVGPKCIVKEENGSTQLYISYGKKSDAELLNNYGFLPGVPCSDGTDEASRDAQRTRLAQAFVQRNP